MKLESPHIPLGISLDEGIEILKSVTPAIEKHKDEEDDFYKIINDNWECGFYEKGGLITSTWYNDPAGRDTDDGVNLKVTQYLSRYGELDDWEDGINNGWIQFFLNTNSGVNMAYGLHKDVIRFNSIT
ncbi:MAG: hypothetical protein MJK04_29920 [Psychrosphaera sp.]|nr:hypothetical protein [Psychrosphaera sp.]